MAARMNWGIAAEIAEVLRRPEVRRYGVTK